MRISLELLTNAQPFRYTTNSTTVAIDNARQLADAVLQLVAVHGNRRIGDGRKTIEEHMVQCAVFAMEALSPLPVIVAALLHNIGALQAKQAGDINDDNDYSRQGMGFLKSCHFSDQVICITGQQPAATRYLATVDKTFRSNLSAKSLPLLFKQGDRMTAHEIVAFQQAPYFEETVQVCRWHQQAIQESTKTLQIYWFRKLLVDHLVYRVGNSATANLVH